MAKTSAGLLMYRIRDGRLQVLLVHPGGPFWAKKDHGAWSIPKGELSGGEDAVVCAIREFKEETGITPEGRFLPLGTVTQKSGKTVNAWAFEGDCDATKICSNVFVMEWPPRSGQKREFPEVDRAEFFEIQEAKRRINPAQAPFLVELARLLSGS